MSHPLRIHSPRNERVKLAVELRAHKGRVGQGRFLIDGVREIARAADADVVFDEVFVCSELLRTPVAHDVVARSVARCSRVYEISKPLWDRLKYGDRQDGLIVAALTPQRSLGDLPLTSQSLVVVLQGVEKPGNVGAIVRSADAAGAAGVILADGSTDLYNPNAIRASIGALFHVPVIWASTKIVQDWLRRQDFQVVVAFVDAPQTVWEASLVERTALVLGSEATGLGDEWRQPGMTAVRLPMVGLGDSLNVSVTAAVLLYEAARQRSAR